ncbi:MAG: efflux RND transporter periplasmic adaptor subunit [Myxococcales bacterium]|nr:efflux RND transporter periplasmic adaptor subunit [Myxococcales bacterium]
MSEQPNKVATVLKVVLPLLVIAAGVGFFRFVVSRKPEAPRQPQVDTALLVETTVVERGRHEVAVRANGQVVAAELVVLSPEVTGRVRAMSPELVPGGRFRAGETMLRIDPRDYQLAVDAQSAEVNRAQLELQLEEGRQRIAEREWALFEREPQEAGAGRALALREPQVETARVAVRSAQSSAQRARLALEKATLRAPFNGMVLSENVDLGQVVGPQTQVATLVGTDAFWVRVSVPVASLATLRFPDRHGEGSPVRVWQSVNGQRIEREGRLLRLLPDVDPVGSMARVIVRIDDPLALQGERRGSLPMLLGSYVDVELGAAPLDDVVELPRLALREGNKVYVMTPERTLAVREVEIVWSRPETVLVRDGLASGEQVVTSRVPTPVAGLPLRTATEPREVVAERAGASREVVR